MQTVSTPDLRGLILKGISSVGGESSDIEYLEPEWLVALGKRVANIGARKQRKHLPVRVVPQNGEVFEMTLFGDAPDPIEMLRSDGYDFLERWEFKGPKVRRMQTKKFKLVSVGYQSNGDAVNKVLVEHGRPARGQWRDVFMRKYARPDGKGPIGFTGSEWVSWASNSCFPCVNGVRRKWRSSFQWFYLDFDDFWRFVVEVK